MEEKKGKAYANRKPLGNRPESDFYETPYCLTEELIRTGILDRSEKILEPCCGDYAISKVLEKHGFNVTSKDIKYGQDFFTEHYNEGDFDTIVTNPPFSQFDEMIRKFKRVAPKVVVIGKVNFFGVQSRLEEGFWKGLSDVYVFSRQLDYRTPIREDGHVCVGNLVTCWMVWNRDYTEAPRMHFIDIQKYCTLGGYDVYMKKTNQKGSMK